MATKLQIKREVEWRKCQLSARYFLETYWFVETVGTGYAQMTLYDYQVEDLAEMEEAHRIADEDGIPIREVRLKARQLGWTTLADGFAFWSAYFHDYHPWLQTSTSEDEAKDTLNTKLKIPFSYLPEWMRKRGPQITTETSEEIGFDNGSRIVVVPSTSRAGRGKAMFGVLMDEAAFMEDAAGLFAALDPLCYGPLFLFSTANGMGNFFHEIWLDSSKPDSEWRGRFRSWRTRPERDDEWYERTKRKFRTQPHLFYQEYPSNPEEAFLKSGLTALNVDKLREMPYWREPEARYDLSFIYAGAQRGMSIERLLREALIPDGEERILEFHVWQHPYLERGPDGRLARKPNFAIGADTAEGLLHGDYSAISVWDVHGHEQVATVEAHIPIEELGWYIEWIGYWYYTALILVERNNMGLVPLTYLQKARYPRLYRMDTIAQIRKGDRTVRYGWFTNKATKPKMIVDFNKAIGDEAMVLSDGRFLQESFTFLADGKGGYGANSPNHDDLIDATLISYQGALDVGEYPVVWVDPDPGPLTFDQVFEAMGGPDPKAAMLNVTERGYALAQGIGQSERTDSGSRSWDMVVDG